MGFLFFIGEFLHSPMCWQRPIFPCSLPQSIFATAELNFRVRNGNGWTLTVKNTNYLRYYTLKTEQKKDGKAACITVGQALGLLVPVG